MRPMSQEEIGAVGGDAEDLPDHGGTPPVMPHLECITQDELDMRYPRLVAPEEEDLYDGNNDATDTVLQKGLEIARKIQDEAVAMGRRRHAGDAARNDNNSNTKDDDKLNDDDNIDSNLNSIDYQRYHRRRSSKICCPIPPIPDQMSIHESKVPELVAKVSAEVSAEPSRCFASSSESLFVSAVRRQHMGRMRLRVAAQLDRTTSTANTQLLRDNMNRNSIHVSSVDFGFKLLL